MENSKSGSQGTPAETSDCFCVVIHGSWQLSRRRSKQGQVQKCKLERLRLPPVPSPMRVHVDVGVVGMPFSLGAAERERGSKCPRSSHRMLPPERSGCFSPQSTSPLKQVLVPASRSIWGTLTVTHTHSQVYTFQNARICCPPPAGRTRREQEVSSLGN